MAAMSSGGVLFSLLGFRQVVIMMSKIEKPGKYVPIVLVSSLLMTTFLYTALQWSFIGSVDAQDLANGWANLSFTGDAGPFAALAALAGMIWLSVLLYADAFISPYSTGLVYSTTAAHMLATMDSIIQVPKILAKENKYQVPWVSLLVNFFLAAIMSIVLHGWQEMSSFLVTILMVSYAIGPICVTCLRTQLPDYIRPFRVRCNRMVGFIGFYICTIGVYWAGFQSIKKLLAITILGLVASFIYCLIKKSYQHLDFRNAIWLLLYLVGLGTFSYFGNYGGTHSLPQYWDLLDLLVFSLVIFILAIFSKKDTAYTQKLVNETVISPG